NHGQNEHVTYTLPAVLDDRSAIGGIPDEMPEIWWPSRSSVRQTCANRKKRGHERLQNEPELHRLADSRKHVRREPYPHVFHKPLLSGRAAGSFPERSFFGINRVRHRRGVRDDLRKVITYSEHSEKKRRKTGDERGVIEGPAFRIQREDRVEQ